MPRLRACLCLCLALSAGPNFGGVVLAAESIDRFLKTDGEVPMGSSGIQIRFETDLIIEGIRPGRVVRIGPGNGPQVQRPREEYLNDANSLEERYPSPAIFPKY